MLTTNQKNKAVVWDFWQKMNHTDPKNIAKVIQEALHEDVNWNGSHPLNQLQGTDALITGFWQPLLHSFPDLKRNAHIFMGGQSGEEAWVSGLGYLTGTFTKNWLGIPATGEKTNIHFGQFYLMQEGKIAESYVIFDLLAVMRQAGFQVLPPALGAEGGKVPAPHTGDGVLLTEQDALESRKTGQLVEAIIQGLLRYDCRAKDGSIRSMEQEHYWHPQMHWYGPTGIGSCFSFEEFVDFQLQPWMHSFGEWPDLDEDNGRVIGLTEGDYLAEGQYASLGVWDTPFSLHHEAYLGFPATGKLLTMRDFDWYRREGNLLIQNWVPIDMIDLFKQMGVDLFERMRHQIEQQSVGNWW
ncbi:ester cyclase [Candidatus Leptofilum sp.]|uniref:nuclear transport factor 2 family protein n=1 Tax=Candidatus Leptofilum sp. TaxID=3241576 RepID=UPI003B5B78E6